MPQATNLKLVRDRNQCPVGKGTVHGSLQTISNLTRARAAKLNILEAERTERLTKQWDRDRKRNEAMADKVIDKTRKSLDNLKAFRYVLNNDYSAETFTTLCPGYKRQLVQTPNTARRFKLETRIYHSGFEMKFFKPEIAKRLQQLDPNRINKIFQKILLEKYKIKSDLLLDRNMSKSTFDMLLRNKEDLKKFSYHRQKSKVMFEKAVPPSLTSVDEEVQDMTSSQ